MAKIDLGSKIVCDGHYIDSDGKRVHCERELPAGTHAIVNRVGVMGHHCEMCHDPERTKAIAAGLGISTEEMYERWHKLDAAQKALDDKLAKATKKNGNGKGKPAAATESEPADNGEVKPADVASTQGEWPPAEDKE